MDNANYGASGIGKLVVGLNQMTVLWLRESKIFAQVPKWLKLIIPQINPQIIPQVIPQKKNQVHNNERVTKPPPFNLDPK
jgi:hypothetical protein